MTISVILILGLILFILIAYNGLNKMHAFIAVLFGIYLGGYEWGAKIHTWSDGLFHALSTMQF